MNCSKLFLSSLITSLLVANVAYANPFNKINLLPNNIPTPIQFMISKNSNNSAEISFPKTAIPARLYCYFATPNNLRYKGILAHFSSDNSKITFQPGVDSILAGGGSEVEILEIELVAGNSNTGSINITLDGDINVTTATIMCAMQKIK